MCPGMDQLAKVKLQVEISWVCGSGKLANHCLSAAGLSGHKVLGELNQMLKVRNSLI